MVDIGIPIGRASEHNAISARTPPDSDTQKTITPTVTEAFTPSADINDIEFSMNGNTADNLEMSDFLNFDSGCDPWSFPLEQGAHGESGGFMGDMNWIDQGTTSWSRLNSPMRDVGLEKHTNWDSPGPAPLFGIRGIEEEKGKDIA